MSTNATIPCKCCYGSRVQVNKDGIRIRCPCCGGTGIWKDTKYRVTWRGKNYEFSARIQSEWTEKILGN